MSGSAMIAVSEKSWKTGLSRKLSPSNKGLGVLPELLHSQPPSALVPDCICMGITPVLVIRQLCPTYDCLEELYLRKLPQALIIAFCPLKN